MGVAVLERPTVRTEDARTQDLRGRISENYARLIAGTPVASAMPAPAPAPVFEQEASVAVEAPAVTAPAPHRDLFAGLSYRDGVLCNEAGTPVLSRPAVVEAPAEVATPAPAPVEAPVRQERAEELVRPSYVSTVERVEEAQKSVFSAIGAKAKAVLAVLALFIVTAIVLICMNTAMLNGLKTEYADAQNASQNLTEQYVALQEDIVEATSDEAIAQYYATSRK